MHKRFLLIAALLLGGLIVFSAGPITNAAGLAQSSTPTPAAEEETEHAHDISSDETMDHESMDHEVTIAKLTAQVEALQAQVAALEASIQINQVNNAIYQLDLVGLHALDERLNDSGEIQSSDSSRVGAIARLLSTVHWPEALASDAASLTLTLQDLAAALSAEDLETSAELAIVAHGDQHALSHAAEQWITSGGEHADHGDMGGHDHMHSNDSAGVIDVDGLLIENVRANLSLPSTTGSVWVKITNTTDVDEALIGAAIPGCGVIELHNMIMRGDVMVMQQVEGGEIAIPAGETVELQRGGLHIMCIQKEAPLEVGSAVDITLEFANAGEVEVTAPVVAPDDMGGMDHGEEEHDHDHGTGG
jgi:copper(I)-binding protein